MEAPVLMAEDRKLDLEARTLLAELMDEESALVAVDKNEFLPGLPLPTDVFIQLPGGKFIQIAKKGTKSSLGELHVTQNNEINAFFVRRDEYYSAVEQNLKIAGILVKKKDIEVERRTGFLSIAARSVHKELAMMGLSPTSIGHSVTTIRSVCALVGARDEYFKLISSLHQNNDKLIQSAIAGAALSTLIAREMGWSLGANIEKLALAAFLRDVGLKEIPKELAEKPRHEMGFEERALWETHCFRGAQLLSGLPDLPGEVVSVALEHHENAIGQGFPRRIRDLKMNPYSKIVALADCFVDLTLLSSLQGAAMTPDQAVHHIELGLGSPYNKATTVALKRALGIQELSSKDSAASDDGAAVQATETASRKFGT